MTAQTLTWTPAPAGYEGETGSHIAAQAASRLFTAYRTADGYAWESMDAGSVRLPDGTSCAVQYQAARLAPDVAARVRQVLRTAWDLQKRYPVAPRTGPSADAQLAAHDALMVRMDRAGSAL